MPRMYVHFAVFMQASSARRLHACNSRVTEVGRTPAAAGRAPATELDRDPDLLRWWSTRRHM